MAYLQILNGSREQQVERLDPAGSMLIGSGQVHVRVPDAGVEAQHCQVYPARNVFWLQDLGAGSTHLRGKPLQGRTEALKPGDVFVVGRTSIRFLAEDPAAVAAASPTPAAPAGGLAAPPARTGTVRLVPPPGSRPPGPAFPTQARPGSQPPGPRPSAPAPRPATTAPATTPPTLAPALPGSTLPGAPSGRTGATTKLAALPPGPIEAPSSRHAGHDPGDPRILAWLCCDPFPPVPIGPEPVLTIGRDPSSGLVLPHGSVSRTHAVVRVSGRELLFEDRSSYGSYANGERVLSRKLLVGDVLILGPYEIRVRGTEDVQAAQGDPLEQTRPIETFRNLPSAEVMSGRLEKSSLDEVLQAIEFNQKTGTLEVFTDDGSKGQLVVYQGSPMCATFADVEGEEAVYAMVGQRRGYFSFRSKIEAGERTIEKPITALLLEAGRRADHAARA